MKKVLSLLLSALLLLSVTAGLDFSIYADELSSGQCGENAYYEFDSATGVLTVSGTGDMFGYDSASPLMQSVSPFEYNESIKSVVFSDGITSVGSFAFCGCTEIASVKLSPSITQIGAYAFFGCESLDGVDIANAVSEIGDSAFENCTGIKNIFIPAGVEAFGKRVFAGCAALESITVDEANAVYDSREGCNAIISTKNNILVSGCKSSVIPDSVRRIGESAFEGCTGLTQIEIGSSVYRIDKAAFASCTDLSVVMIPASVTYIGQSAFSGCVNLSEVYYSAKETEWQNIEIKNGSISPSYEDNGRLLCVQIHFFGSEAEKIDFVFSILNDGTAQISGYTGTESEVVIPSEIRGYAVTAIADYAFADCAVIKAVTIPGSVTSIGTGAFAGCADLESITVAVDNPVYDSRNNCNAIIETETDILVLGCAETVIPDSVVGIGARAFAGCTDLAVVSFPESVTEIGEAAFEGCSSLVSVAVGNGVTHIGDAAFSGCIELTEITVPLSVAYIGQSAFSDCDNLSDIYYSATKTDWQKIEIASRIINPSYSDNSPLENAAIHCICKVSGYVGYLASKDATAGTLGKQKKLQNVVITIEVNGESVVADYSNETGKFTFTDVPDGTYEATLSYAYGIDRTFTIIVDGEDVISDTIIGVVNCNFNNGDNNINANDLKALQPKIGISGRTNAKAYAENYFFDINGDNNINANDLKIFVSFIGTVGRTYKAPAQTIQNA